MLGNAKGLRLHWLAVIVLCVASLPVLTHFGYLREDVHKLIFPICLVAFWRLPRRAEYRIPSSLLAVAAGLWVVATLHVSGMLPEISARGYVLIGRLENDSDGLKARAIYKRYGEISRTYHLMAVDQVYRGFTSSREAMQWVAAERPNSPVIIYGRPDWMIIGINPRMNENILSSSFGKTAFPAVSPAIAPFAEQAGDLPRTTSVQLWWTSHPFYVRLLPRTLPLPGNSVEQSLHFLAYAAQAIRFEDHAETLELRAEVLAMRRDALYGIANLEGPWGSGTMLGFAHYLIGTLDLIEALQQGDPMSEQYKVALDHLQQASSLVVRNHAPELYSDVLNNAAIALIAQSQEVEDFQKARGWMTLAFAMTGKSSATSDEAQTALANLSSLDLARTAH